MRTVDQYTHQAEHVLGYKVLSPWIPRQGTAKFKQLKSEEKKELARATEGDAPAYHEVFSLHRAHPGTGTGAPGNRYRRDQRAALEGQRLPVQGDSSVQDAPPKSRYSNAVQLNQLDYAQMLHGAMDPDAQKFFANKEEFAIKAPKVQPGEDALKMANTSFKVMVAGVNSVTFLTDDDRRISIPVCSIEKCEQELARIAATTGRWPTAGEQKEVMDRYGVPSKIFSLKDGTTYYLADEAAVVKDPPRSDQGDQPMPDQSDQPMPDQSDPSTGSGD
jgi:hypothetical protein